jgi:photosystem II stability/assembly factor-like uncharacterized protein
MKRKSLLALSAAALVTLSSWYAFSGEKKIASYTPREQKLEGTYYESLPYMKKLRGNIETGEFLPSDYLEVANAVADYDRNFGDNRSLNLHWWEMGPDNVGGRTRAILAVNNDLIFAGSVTGGLFKSTNAGNNWTRVESLDAIGKTMAISCIDQTGDGTIYIGTGSVFEGQSGGTGGSGSIGVGLYRSTDLGVSWELVPGTNPVEFNSNEDWAFINDICADTNDPSKIWIASNAGTGWWKPGEAAPDMTNTGLPGSTSHDIEWAKDGSYCLVTAANGNIYKSTNNGDSFSNIAPNAGNTSRGRTAISPSNPNVCYALFSTIAGKMAGLFYSNNKGDSWTEVWPNGIDDTYDVFANDQGKYDMALIVNPEDEDIAWVGGVTLWRSGNGTQPEQIAYNFGFGGFEFYVHSDIHTFEIAPNGDWYIGSDGGVSKSTDGGATYVTMNRGYNVTQFYNIAHSSGYPVMGGTQDNGTQVVVGIDNGFFDVITDQQAFELMGGDGFGCEMSQVSEGSPLLFGSSYFGTIERHEANGSGGAFYDNDILLLTNPDAVLGLGIGIFNTPMRLFEDTEDELSQQYIWAVNPTTHTIADTTITVFTQNMNLPFSYYIPANDPLEFWPTLIRPTFSSDVLYTTDPNFPWLDAQESESDVDTTYQQVQDGTEFIPQYDTTSFTFYWTDSLFIEETNTWYYVQDSTTLILDIDTTEIEVPVFVTETTLDTTYIYLADTLENIKEQRLVQDTYTSLFATGFVGSQGVWATRQALNLNVTPDWWRIGNAPQFGIKSMEYSPDGNVLWYSGYSGELVRVSGLDYCYNQEDANNLDVDQLINSGAIITSIAVDPNNSEHVVITIGGYGTSSAGKVRETFNALDPVPTWDNIWEFENPAMERMPIFSSIIHVDDPDVIVVGTDFGVYATSDGGDSWTHTDQVGEWAERPVSQSVGKLNYVPVFDLRQQKYDNRRFMNTQNYGVIYAGTHGRGIFRSADLFNTVEEMPDQISNANLNVYPNPANETAFLDVNLKQSERNVNINVYDIHGKLIKTISRNFLSAGNHKISLEAEDLPSGNYIVSLNAGSTQGVGKFIKVN